MRRTFLLACALVVALVLSGPTYADRDDHGDGLQMYTATVGADQVQDLVRRGFDVAAISKVTGGDDETPGRVEVTLVLSPDEARQLEAKDVQLDEWRDRRGNTAAQATAVQQAAGYAVYRSYDEPGGIRDELYALARAHPKIVKLRVIGRTIQGREIIALRVTGGAEDDDEGEDDEDDEGEGRKPAVLYIGTQHAREWLATEVTRRLLHHFVDNYGTDRAVTQLVNTRRLWFVVVANPDGYQYTFEHERLWRKNLRDNDGDGQITGADGVDPNRNFPEHWNYDEEGSSSLFASETYRGTGPASEPETKAMISLSRQIRPKMVINYHTFGNLILYTFGWQVQTPTADDPIYVALSGTDKNPAIPGYDPGVGAELYITNGETTDYMHADRRALAWTVELSTGFGFTFPDDEALIQAEFEKNLPFALDVTKSAADPTRPTSHQGRSTKPFYLEMDQDDPEKWNNPLVDFKFDVSYGNPQPVQVLARRDLGRVTLRYSINNGPRRSNPTREWRGGERFGDKGDVYYHVMRGEVTGTRPGDTVRVWFEARNGREESESFTYSVKSDSGAPVLVLAAEDYSGISTSPPYPPGPRPFFLSYYASALAANGIAHDVYDVDANNRQSPDPLGVLSHYRAVIWYTGNDVITREPYQGPGNVSRLANEEMLDVRMHLNNGGRLLHTGKYAGHQFFTGHGTQVFDPEQNAACVDPGPICDPLSDDFFQYYLGAYLLNEDAGTTGDTLYPVNGVDIPFSGLSWAFNGADSADNQDHSASFLATSGILDPATYPQFRSSASAKYDRPGGPFEPHTGQYYVYSQIADVTYKRLMRTIDVPAAGGNLSVWMSADTEPDWDFRFIEVHTVGQDNWTTLPDLNGHTSQNTGESCPAGWHQIHPFLEHYQTFDETAGTCSPTGTTGTWNAASGNSGGWEEWVVDLDAYAGKQIELSISYVSDWAVQGLGVFVDDITLPDGSSTSFEAGLDGWTVAGAPPGSSPNPNDWARITAGGFPEGAAITTEDTIYFGFGFEGIQGAASRNSVLDRAMDYLLR